MRRILVVGAGGFVGGHVVRHLAGLEETTVRATRRPTGSPVHSGDGVEVVTADLTDAPSLAAACKGVDAVVNCAIGDRAATVNGTQAILNAARAAGVPRVVQMSSAAVYGSARGEISEDTPIIRPSGTDYASMKAEAELLCQAAAGKDLTVVCLRPSVIMGPGSVVWAGLTARRLASRRWGTMGHAGNGTCNMVDVADVARAVDAALTAPLSGFQAFNLNGSDCLTWNSVVAKYNDALDLPTVREWKPEILGLRILVGLPLRLAARKMPFLRKKAAPTLLTTPTFVELDLYRLPATYPITKAAKALGWRPAVGLDDTLATAAAWAKAEGLTTQ